MQWTHTSSCRAPHIKACCAARELGKGHADCWHANHSRIPFAENGPVKRRFDTKTGAGRLVCQPHSPSQWITQLIIASFQRFPSQMPPWGGLELEVHYRYSVPSHSLDADPDASSRKPRQTSSAATFIWCHRFCYKPSPHCRKTARVRDQDSVTQTAASLADVPTARGRLSTVDSRPHACHNILPQRDQVISREDMNRVFELADRCSRETSHPHLSTNGLANTKGTLVRRDGSGG